MLKFAIIFLYVLGVFFISIIFKKFNKNNKELLRKIIHIGIGPLIPIAIFLDIEQNSALIFTGLMSIIVLINYLYKLFPTIEDVDRKSFGTLFYCFSLFILILLFWEKDSDALIAGFLIMTFGDGFAGLIGKNIKSKSWFIFNQKKSLIGTLTMFFTSLIIVCSLGYIEQYNFNYYFLCIALLATILEQFSLVGIDNLIVPVSTSIYFNIFITN